jgi:DNA-binding XRE family transcriptional regulator
MAKKALAKRTPAALLWALIDAERVRQQMTADTLAKRVGVSRGTVTTDARDPYKIPQGRLWLYFAVLGIDAGAVLHAFVSAYLEEGTP